MFKIKLEAAVHIEINDRAEIAVRKHDSDHEYGARSIVEMTKEYCELFEMDHNGIITWDCKDLVEDLQKELADALAVVTKYVDATNQQSVV